MSEIERKYQKQIDEIIEHLKILCTQHERAPKKGFFEKLTSLSPLISGVLISGVATFATITYNERQMQLTQLNALDKYRTYLASENPQEREFGYQAFLALGQETFVIKLIGARKDNAGFNIVATLAETTQDKTTRKAAQRSLLNLSQEKRIKAIIHIFETGSQEPQYGKIDRYNNTIYYGYADYQISNGTLFSLIKNYVEQQGSQYGDSFLAYIPRLEKGDISLSEDNAFINLLHVSADDPVMQKFQDKYIDQFFIQTYRITDKLGIRSPLGIAAIYDSVVQGSETPIQDKTQKQLNGTPASGISEKLWIKTYLKTRKEWLLSVKLPQMNEVAYRPEALLALANQDNWELLPPIRIRGKQLTE